MIDIADEFFLIIVLSICPQSRHGFDARGARPMLANSANAGQSSSSYRTVRQCIGLSDRYAKLRSIAKTDCFHNDLVDLGICGEDGSSHCIKYS